MDGCREYKVKGIPKRAQEIMVAKCLTFQEKKLKLRPREPKNSL
jgi:hypothetical protein